MDDTDLAGPLVFCLALGTFLLLVRQKETLIRTGRKGNFTGIHVHCTGKF